MSNSKKVLVEWEEAKSFRSGCKDKREVSREVIIDSTQVTAITFESVNKTYRNGVEALKGISFQVSEGDIYGFAGPNGAGKSTAIKILVGLVRPTSGTTKIFSEPGGSREAKQMIGYLPEVTLYHEFMTVEELLKIHATLAGIPASDAKDNCEKALERVGLSDRRKSRLKEFSKGMKQRFGIAQAIVGDPKILVFDELTSGLDPLAQASLLDLLTELRDQGLTIFFSSHHLREIERICDSVAVIDKGKIRYAGCLDKLLGEEEAPETVVRRHRALEDVFCELVTEKVEEKTA